MTNRCTHCERYEAAIDELDRAFDGFDWTKHDDLSLAQKMALQTMNEARLKATEGRGWDVAFDDAYQRIAAEFNGQ